MNISYSRVSSYLTCPYQHFLGYEIGVYKKKPQRPLKFGSDFHKLLEVRGDTSALADVYKEISDAYYDMPPEFQADLGDNYLLDLWDIFNDYCEVYKGEKLPTITEKEFDISIDEQIGKAFGYSSVEPLVFKGFIDELYLRKSKKTGKKSITIGEHKTFNKKPSMENLTLNTQKNLYAKAVQYLYGVMPNRIIWDYISSKPAKEPKLSSISLGKIDKGVTPFSFTRWALREPDTVWVKQPDLIGAQKEVYRENIPDFFFRVEQDYDPQAVEIVWKGFLYNAMLIADHGHKNTCKHTGPHCSWCSYKSICYAEMTSANVDYLLEKEYEVKPREDIQESKRKAKWRV